MLAMRLWWVRCANRNGAQAERHAGHRRAGVVAAQPAGEQERAQPGHREADDDDGVVGQHRREHEEQPVRRVEDRHLVGGQQRVAGEGVGVPHGQAPVAHDASREHVLGEQLVVRVAGRDEPPPEQAGGEHEERPHDRHPGERGGHTAETLPVASGRDRRPGRWSRCRAHAARPRRRGRSRERGGGRQHRRRRRPPRPPRQPRPRHRHLHPRGRHQPRDGLGPRRRDVGGDGRARALRRRAHLVPPRRPRPGDPPLPHAPPAAREPRSRR